MTRDNQSGPILVLGATGRHGGTGAHLVTRLREEGRAVRVLARTLDDRTDRLTELGAEVVVGDLFDRRTLLPALADVDLAYFTYPIAAGVLDAAANYAAAVREVGRNPRTVVMSMGPSHPASPSNLGRAQWLAEEVLQWAGLDLLVLRIPALFHENLVVLHSHSIRQDGVFRNSFADAAMGWINSIDAAELAVAGLLHPEYFEGKTIVYPLGSEQYTHAGIASLLSDLLGSQVRFEPVGKDQWRADLLALADHDGEKVVNPAMAQHISAVGAMSSAGNPPGADPDALSQLTGRKPVALRDFLSANLVSFIGK